MTVLSGCIQSPISEKPKDPWLEFYTKDLSKIEVKKHVENEIKKYSFSIQDMDLALFVRLFSDKTGAGIIYSVDADSFKFTAEFKGNTPDEIMTMLARRYDFELVKQGSTYYVGKLRPEDRGMFIKKIKGYDSVEIQEAVTIFLSDIGKSYTQKDGVILISDRESVLSRISDMFDQLENLSENSWIIQYYLVSQRKELKVQAGGDLKTSGQLAYNYNKDGGFTYTAKDLGQSLEIVLNFSSDLINVHAMPMFLIRDGCRAYWQDGTSYPIPKKTVSDYGTVTTTGYDYKDTGLVISTTLRECKQGAILTLDIQDSTITGYVDGSQPILSKTQLTSESIVKSGHVYLMGEFNLSRKIGDQANVLDFTASDSKVAIQLFCRTYKIERYTNVSSNNNKTEQKERSSGD